MQAVVSLLITVAVELGRWDVNGVNFGETASDVSLDDRRPDYGLYLCASLQRRDGSWTGFVEIDIANALSNDDGNFVWYVYPSGFL